MTQSQMITARMTGFKTFRRKVKKMLEAHPDMNYREAAGFVKKGFKPNGPELAGNWKESALAKPTQEQPAPEEKHQQFVLVIGDGAYKLLSMSNGNGAVEVKQLPFSVVKL